MPANGAAPTITLLAGELATIDAQGRVQQASAGGPLLPSQPGNPTGIGMPAALPNMAGAPPARTPGQTLLAQAQVALQDMLGLPAQAAQGQQPQGNATWTLGGTTLGLLPLGMPQIDLTLPNGASLRPDGTLRVVHQGVVQRFAPAPMDLQAAGDALRAALPTGSVLRIGATGTWWAESSAPNAAPLVLRPGWLAQQGAPLQPPAPAGRLETDAAGQLWLAQASGLRTPLYPALADATALQALLLAVDAQSALQVQLDGTALVRLAGQGFHLSPLPSFQSPPAQQAGQALWLESTAQGQLLLWVRVGEGGRWAQAMVVSLAQ